MCVAGLPFSILVLFRNMAVKALGWGECIRRSGIAQRYSAALLLQYPFMAWCSVLRS